MPLVGGPFYGNMVDTPDGLGLLHLMVYPTKDAGPLPRRAAPRPRDVCVTEVTYEIVRMMPERYSYWRFVS